MMVSAKPNKPKGPLVRVSWRRPTSRPTSSPESELPRSPWSATTTRKTSTALTKSGQSRTPMKWTSAASAMVAISLRLSTGGGLFEGLRHGLIFQQVDLVESAEVDRRSDVDAMEELPPWLDGGDRADGDAARIDAVDAGGQHAVARPHVGLQGDVVELEPGAQAAAHHPLAAGAQDHAPDSGGAVGDQLHLGVGAGDVDHPADEAVAGEHRLIVPRLHLAGIEDQGAQPGGVVGVDDVDRPDAPGGRGGVAHGVPQTDQLPLDVGQPQQAQAQVLGLPPQLPVLLEQRAT